MPKRNHLKRLSEDQRRQQQDQQEKPTDNGLD
jgi:hypothetical protein